MTRKIFVFAALLAAACSNAPTPEQQRIAELEAQNARLQEELRQAKENFDKLQRIRAEAEAAPADDGAAEAGGAGQGVNPVPDNNLGGGSQTIQ